ncbi:MAG: VacJ family lipoprotein [Dechloromonas sp.]|nr:VacJ family lipoprotein [Dechloromonas sp.]
MKINMHALACCGRRLAASSLFGLVLVSTVQAQGNPQDPYESFNRAMFSANEVIDQYALRPLARVYDVATPLPVKASVGNFFGNAGDLMVGVNNALQGKVSSAGNDFARLLINSTLGIFGLFDVASELGYYRNDEDFGQTLAVWGVDSGAYLYLPIFGPRTLRDTAGLLVDSFSDPVGQIDEVALRNSVRGLRIVDLRAGLLPADKVVEEAALDKYSYIRAAYLQRRTSQIYDGRPPRLDD